MQQLGMRKLEHQIFCVPKHLIFLKIMDEENFVFWSVSKICEKDLFIET